ncbi:hypothetical protein [Novosphingobium aquimarinum]|uniref:hypothetical protein n=1 Tax=Novosphingobium aquimarinum TaxID=2682494 RepID=UPI001E4BED3D|nr:hypothetical protein [Novosphingobium aquimarinum]
MTEPAAAGATQPRAFLRVAGVTLARHQLVLAQALSCQRIICIARSPWPEMLALQHAAEDAGLQFHKVSAPQQMASLVTATDDVFVFAEGLLANVAVAVPLLDSGPGVLVQPVDAALAAGFERLDINNASAGALRIPGRLVDQLHELGADCETTSSLTRIALQSGIPIREVPAADRAANRWTMIRSESQAHAHERQWLRSRLGDARGPSPGEALVRFGVSAFGPSLLNTGSSSNLLSLAALALLMMAGGLAWFGIFAASFVAAGLAWLVGRGSGLVRAAERDAIGISGPAITRSEVLAWLIDLVLIALMVATWREQAYGTAVNALFAPLLLVLLLYLVRRLFVGRSAALLGDRASLALVLCLAAAAGIIAPVIQVLCVVLVVAGLLIPPRLHG